jgi:hypothetical protein
MEHERSLVRSKQLAGREGNDLIVRDGDQL